MLSNYTAKNFFEDTQSAEITESNFATVVASSAQGVKIRIDGEAKAGEKYYKRLASYAPVINDRVYFIRVSGTILILGKVV